jgi:hypothetical protein
MNAQRLGTAPPYNLAEAVTNSLRSDVSRKPDFSFSETPPWHRSPGPLQAWLEPGGVCTRGIVFPTASFHPFSNLSGFPL